MGKAARAGLSLVLSVLLAFFPKCAICWAAYVSMFGSLWLAQLPYLEWLFPMLLVLSTVHLLLLLKKAKQNGYGPFLLNLVGISIILCGRGFFPFERWVLFCGMSLVVIGSLMNSFSADRIDPFLAHTSPRKDRA